MRLCLIPGFEDNLMALTTGESIEFDLTFPADYAETSLAGLWSGWRDPETDEVRRTFTIITTTPNDLMRPIHNRMPVVLAEEAWDLWLDTGLPDPGELQGLLVPAADADLEAYPVNRAVNNVRNDGPSLIERLTDPDDLKLI